MNSLLQDIRYGVRSLAHAPTFTVLTILTLMLAIGVNSAIFSMVSTILFAEMPVTDKERTVFVWTNNRERGTDRGPASMADFLDMREQLTSLGAIAAIDSRGGTLAGVEQPMRVEIGLITTNLMSTWGLEPHLGRGFTDDEGLPGAPGVTMLSHGLWERRFGSDPGIVGTEVRIDGRPTTVVGIMSPRMEFGDIALTDLWMPLVPDPTATRRDERRLFLTASLADGATLAQASEEAAAVARRLAQAYPETNRGYNIEIVDFQSGLADDQFWIIMTLLGITVGLVMLIACSNVATMTLARATGRQQELAVRAAIGAGRGRIVRQLITESLLISAASGLLGLLVARACLYGLTWIAGENSGIGTFFDMLSIDGPVLVFTLGVSLLAPVLFGLVPALRSARTDLAATLKEGGRTSGDVRSLRGRRVLVATQVSLAIMLMVVAGLLIRGLAMVRAIDYHHDPDSVLTLRVDLPEATYPELDQVRQFRAELVERIEREPSVVRAAWMSSRPLVQNEFTTTASFEIAGAELRDEEQVPFAMPFRVSPAYFDIMKLRPVQGRLFDDGDRAGAAPVALINQEVAERYWEDDDPIGQEIRLGTGEWMQVVGVVTDEVFPDFERTSVPQIYMPIAQHTAYGAALLVETTGDDALALTPAIRSAVRAIDPEQPIADVRTQGRIIADSTSGISAISSILGVFAAFALVMAGAGIYGVLSFMVAERRREFGIRMALGASAGSVRKMVMGSSTLLIGLGVVVGLVGAYGLGRILASALPELNPAEPVVYAVVGVVLFSVAALAAWVPARRATRVEPVIALRAE